MKVEGAGLRLLQRVAMACLALACSACMTLSPAQRDRAEAVAANARSVVVDCQREDHCAQPSPLRDLGGAAFAESAPGKPRHYALLLDRGSDALLARVNLIRSAQRSIDLQTYIFDEDDAGQLVLGELLAAARRGVQVRVLIDQLAALENVSSLAAMSGAHANFELRVYNPVLGKAQISYPQWLLAAACCWRKLNQRMHSKLLLVDDAVGITGGRNYQDDYYDWDVEYNFRDRDVLVGGPVAAEMKANFVAFWASPRSVPAARLSDVGRWLLQKGVPPPPVPTYLQPQRAEAMLLAADDEAVVRQRLSTQALPVGAVTFLADQPAKHRGDKAATGSETSPGLRALIESAQEEVLLQTPYLVLSKPAQRMFEALQDRPHPPRVVISTNSLAATDAFIAYALSHKYKRRYLRDFGFHIYEYKPFPADAPIDLAATGVVLPEIGPESDVALDGSATRERRRRAIRREHVATRYLGSGANDRVPLRRAGVRIGLHAKSMVVDERVAVIGTHNFDPRGDRYNTESAVVIDDLAFARALAASIRRDNAPENAWVVAPRDKLPVLWGLEYSLGKLSEKLPIFDLWPTRYATSYAFVPGPGCPLPVPRDHPNFRDCYRPVGDFPEVAVGLKDLTTRIFTAFGAGLAPIL
jgi:phosphatidylserine/phosphatidylglycerophosphate/cardiolipin synthase-like enzyme